MAGKCKIYSKDYILSILKNKFTIKNLKEEYTTKDKLELICNDCDIECTKNIGNKFNGECRNCNMKKSHYNKIDSEVKMYPEIKFEGYTECFTIPIDIKENMKVQRLEL